MKSKINLSQLVILSFFFTLLIGASCSKERSRDEQEEQASMASSESDGEAELIYNGVFDDAMGASDEVGMAGTGIFGRNMATTGGGAGTERPNACFTVTVIHLTTNTFPVRVIIDFGTAGTCINPDGHIRRGRIITDYTNRLLVPGAMATTTFDNYYIDSIKVEGTHRITNTSPPVTTIPPSRQFTVDVIDGKLLKPNGNYTEWSSHKVITQIEGLLTPTFPHDDIFKIEGSAHGRVRRGTLLVAWESTITDPLIKRFNCRWIVRGRVRTVRVSTSTTTQWVAILDFGNGTCDNQAVIIINGVPHNITLH